MQALGVIWQLSNAFQRKWGGAFILHLLVSGSDQCKSLHNNTYSNNFAKTHYHTNKSKHLFDLKGLKIIGQTGALGRNKTSSLKIRKKFVKGSWTIKEGKRTKLLLIIITIFYEHLRSSLLPIRITTGNFWKGRQKQKSIFCHSTFIWA